MFRVKLLFSLLLLLFCFLSFPSKASFPSTNEFENEVENEFEFKSYLSVPEIDLKVLVKESFSYSDLENFAVVNFYPDIDGNTVIYGHRYTNMNVFSSVFSKLDEVKVGGYIELGWKGNLYIYSVVQKYSVYPNEVWILSEKRVPTLTLITCTPLFHPIFRLVIIAALVRID